MKSFLFFWKHPAFTGFVQKHRNWFRLYFAILETVYFSTFFLLMLAKIHRARPIIGLSSPVVNFFSACYAVSFLLLYFSMPFFLALNPRHAAVAAILLGVSFLLAGFFFVQT